MLKKRLCGLFLVLFAYDTNAKTTDIHQTSEANLHEKAEHYSTYTDTVNCEYIPQHPAMVYSERCQSLDSNYQIWKQNYEVQTWLNIRYQSYHLNHQATLLPMTVGEKVEWRYFLKENQPHYYALIYRIYVYDDYETETLLKPAKSSYLIVVKLNQEKSCIVAKINGNQKDANQKARLIADRSLNHQTPCLFEMWDENAEPEFTK